MGEAKVLGDSQDFMKGLVQQHTEVCNRLRRKSEKFKIGDSCPELAKLRNLLTLKEADSRQRERRIENGKV